MTTAKELASIGQLSDVKTVLDEALAMNLPHGAQCGTLSFDTPGKAVNWRQRAYRFRKLWREHRDINSPYETLTLPKLEPGATEVIIKKTGVPVTFVRSVPAEHDDLLDVAKDVAKGLLGDL